jgi:hypothetical protein
LQLQADEPFDVVRLDDKVKIGTELATGASSKAIDTAYCFKVEMQRWNGRERESH